MQNNTRKTLKIYWEHAIKYKLSGLIIFFCVVVGSAMSVVTPLYYKQFFDTLGNEGSKEIIANELVGILMMVLVINFIAWVAWRIATFTSTYFYV